MAMKSPEKRTVSGGASIPAAAPLRSASSARASVKPLRSEGQRLLLELTDSLSTIGRAVGATKQAVGLWRAGTNVPDDARRRALEQHYGIPFAAWAGRLEVARPREPDPIAAVDDDEAEPSVMDDCVRLLRSLRKQLGREDLTPRERVQLTEAFSRAVSQKARLERERELLEDRVIREHPKWRRLKAAMLEVLSKHPAAARDFEAVMVRLLDEEEAEDDGQHDS